MKFINLDRCESFVKLIIEGSEYSPCVGLGEKAGSIDPVFFVLLKPALLNA
jgi:hypothetical protein